MTARLLAAALLAIGAAGCSGNEPLSMFGDPSAVGTLRMPGDLSTVIVGAINPYSSALDGFSFQVSGTGAITASGTGTVIASDATGVVIYHNSRLTSRISLLNGAFTPSAFVNQYVSLGGALGTATNGSTLKFNVYVDGAVSCPFNVLLSSDKATVFSRILANPCQI